jgi:transcriptional regulator with XRE-family HTH domain
LDGKLGTARLLAAHDGVQACVAAPSQAALEFGHREGEFVADVCHALKTTFATNIVKPVGGYSPNGQTDHPVSMDVWPQRAAFREALADYQDKTGMTQQEAAMAGGITLFGLRQILYQKTRKPSAKTIKAFAALFGRSITDFMDDPGAPPEGASSESSDMERFMLRTMGSDLGKLTDAQKQSAFEAWRAIVRGYVPPK